MPNKAAVIGPESIMIGFKAFGLDVFFADEKNQAIEHLNNILNAKVYSIVFISAKLAHEMQSEVNNASKLITITILPANEKEEMWADEHLKTLAEKATGVDIWGKLN